MSESVSSSSSPSPASASSLCETDQETLRAEYDLKSADPCPVCTLPIGRHVRRSSTASTAVSSASSHSSFQLGKNTVLPKWRVDHRHAKPFLDQVEHRFIADGVLESAWPRLLLKAMSDVHESSWVNTNIVKPGVDWATARTIFVNHFEVYSYTELLQKDYEECKQGPKESVQLYCDRFMELVSQLCYEDTTDQVILHFLKGLHNSTQGRIREHIRSTRRMQSSLQKLQGLSLTSENQSRVLPVYDIKSLREMVEIALDIDRSNQISTSTLGSSAGSSSSSGSSGNTPSSTETSSSSQKKSCVHHPHSNNHTTAECRNPRAKAFGSASGSSSAAASGTSSSGGGPTVQVNKRGDPVKCFLCGGNHYANDPSCPRRSDRVTRSASGVQKPNPPTSSASSSQSASSTSSTAASSAASSPASIRGSAATITAGPPASTPSSTVSCGSISVPRSSVDRNLSAAVVLPTQLAVFLMVKFNGCVYSTLIDTGAEVSFADAPLVTSWGIPIVPPQQGGKVRLAKADIFTDRVGSAEIDVTALFPSSDRTAITLRCAFELMPIKGVGNDYHFIIGRDLIPVLFPEGSLPFAYLPQQTASSVIVVASSTLVDSLVMSSSDAGMLGFIPSDDQPDNIQLSTPDELEAKYAAPRQQLLQALSPFLAINSEITGFCTVPEAVVRLEIDPADALHLWRRQYPIAHSLRDAASIIIDRWFVEGKIVLAPPGCPYNNPITVAPKKDEHGKLTGARPCLDTRALNRVLKSNDRFLIPHIRTLLDSFAGNSIFSEFDLQEAYLQFPLHPDSQPLTAFTWNGQQYMFAGCPYGISLLTSFFQRIMTRIFSDMAFCSPYVDNLPFAASDWETHLEQAILIVDRCNQVNLKIKPKFNLGHAQLKCLGHVLSVHGVAADPDKLAVVRDWPEPVTGKQLQSFLGLCSFLRQHVRHYAELTAPLEDVKLESAVPWNNELRTSFAVLKEALLRAPVLSFPDFNRPFHIATDASQTGVGGVLFQPQSVGEHITPTNIVALVSKKLQPSQQRWPAYRKELYGIVYSLRRFHSYIWGRDDLVLHTDHKPLTYIYSSVELSHPLQQWLDTILDYSFTIVHRDGILNVIPDAISRMFHAAYSTCPVWGVDGILPTSPLELELNGSSLVGEGDADHSAPQPASSVPSQIQSTSESDLIVELERRGKRCPSSEMERSVLIQKVHSFGHFGREAIFRRLFNDGFWWPNMREEIQEEVNNCDVCNRFVVVKSGFHPAQFITASGPLHHIQVDTSVHLPESPEGHTALLVLIDLFTGFLFLRAVLDTTAVTIAQHLWEIFSIIGFPRIIQSDNGPEYVSDVIRTLIKLTGMDQRLISPYNPRADGKVERAIGVVVMIIKKMLHGTSKHWPLFVPFAQLTYNSKISSLTASSPFALMFAREPNPLRDYSGEEPAMVDLDNWNQYQRKVLSLIYPAISDRIMGLKLRQNEQFNKHHRLITPQSFPTGATVMIKDPSRQNKFEPTYIGPYTIIRRSRGGAYVLKDATGDLLDRHVPADQMKLIARRKRRIDKDQPIYEAQSILTHRGSPGSYEYLVKWKNYDTTDNSWEPASSFLDDSIIQRYWASKGT